MAERLVVRVVELDRVPGGAIGQRRGACRNAARAIDRALRPSALLQHHFAHLLRPWQTRAVKRDAQVIEHQILRALHDVRRKRARAQCGHRLRDGEGRFGGICHRFAWSRDTTRLGPNAGPAGFQCSHESLLGRARWHDPATSSQECVPDVACFAFDARPPARQHSNKTRRAAVQNARHCMRAETRYHKMKRHGAKIHGPSASMPTTT